MARGDAERQGTSRGAEDASRHVRAFDRRLLRLAVPEQRIAIARVLLRDAPILVMDEAVSHLDAGSERALHSALQRVSRGRTTLLIAHRPSTIVLADRIVVIEKGGVAETGSYASLFAAGAR